jgi:hypothetical protein
VLDVAIEDLEGATGARDIVQERERVGRMLTKGTRP